MSAAAGPRGFPSSCPSSDFAACGHGLPSNFCCPQSTWCLALAGNTTTVCCPKFNSCSSILPIPCDIQLQNVTAFPSSPVLTTALGKKLPSCGRTADEATCCPFGYTCDEASGRPLCLLNEIEVPVSSTATADATNGATTSTITVAVSSIVTSVPTVTAPALSSTSTPPLSAIGTSSSSGGLDNRVGIIAGSTTAGAISVIGLIVFAWVYWRRKARRAAHATAAASTFPQSQIYRPFEPFPGYASTAPIQPPDTVARHRTQSTQWFFGPDGQRHLSFPPDQYPVSTVESGPERESGLPAAFEQTGARPMSPVELPATPVPQVVRLAQKGERVRVPPPVIVPPSKFLAYKRAEKS
ncbi:hypothetical protein VTK73DRAFT_9255 [Phialemonium thermophilum]|uniref:Uncharacterized protein n=1 Tax=Phialemonium thermophilum TaxID=223376 RepID=A0ABR3XKU3_9PEZI